MDKPNTTHTQIPLVSCNWIQAGRSCSPLL